MLFPLAMSPLVCPICARRPTLRAVRVLGEKLGSPGTTGNPDPMEAGGIEPPTPPCKGGVFPLAPRPRADPTLAVIGGVERGRGLAACLLDLL